MESEARYALVGTVVLVLLAAMVVAVVWLRRAGGAGDTSQYKIYFARQSLDGLQLRSDVKMRGIVVGSVDSFRISTWKKGSVEVVIRVDDQAPVRASTKAVVERQLVTGLASIRLVTGDEDSPILTKAPETEPYPVIAEGESDFEQLSQSVNQLALKAGDTLNRLNAMLTDENRGSFARALANFEKLSATAERGLRGLDRTLGAADETMASVSAAAEEMQSLGAELTASSAKLAARYDELGKDSGAAVRDVRSSVNRMAEDVAKVSARTDALLATSSAEIGATAHELRVAARSLGAAARRFRDPRAILVGPAAGDMGPGEAR
jgi:phospholipid/cholesterol/gamma-HCH transport system substrate-binding protein